MSPPSLDRWDAAAQEKLWRNSVENSRQAIAKLEAHQPASSFYVLCLAETDAISSLRPECFSSRQAFMRELRRLIAEPTAPSRPVPSVQGYADAQKWFLEMEIKQCEANFRD